MELTHINANGEAHMVDVGEKDKTVRAACAHGRVFMKRETLELIENGNMKKGDVFAAARIAAIMAAKRTHELIPLCHLIPLTGVEVEIKPCPPDSVSVECTVKCCHETGVEMEALTAVSIGALTIYDMCKAVDRSIEIGEIKLLKKSGGKSGDYDRETRREIKSINLNTKKGETARQLSIISAAVQSEIEKASSEGLCYKKFAADLVVTSLNGVSVGDILDFGGAEVEITELGKSCYSDCPLVGRGEACRLKKECAFGCVKKSGDIRVGAEIRKVTHD